MLSIFSIKPRPFEGRHRNLGQRPGIWLAVAAIASVLGVTSAHAQVIVVKSTATEIKAGSLIANNAKISIPKGSKVVFVLPSGASRTVTGPFNGSAADLTKNVKVNKGVFDAVARYVKTGGSNQKSVGAMRSAAPAFSLGKPLPFSWRAVPVTESGDFCVEKGAALSLVRSFTSSAQAVTIIDMKSQRRARIVFAAGSKSSNWPSDLAVDAGSTYTLLTAKRPPRQLRMRVIAPLPSREDTLQVLHVQRCSSQFRAFIRDIQNAG